MADDFSNLKIFKKSLCQETGDNMELKNNVNSKVTSRICFVITRNINRSWADDLGARERIISMNQVYH